MHVEKKRESRRVEGARRTTARPMDESPVEAASPQSAGIVPPDPEVVARPTRRRFTAEDTLRILQWADACTAVGSRGGATARRRTLRLEPDHVASPTYGGGCSRR